MRRSCVLSSCALPLMACAQVLGIEEGAGDVGGLAAGGADPCGSVSILSDDFDGAALAPSWTELGESGMITRADVKRWRGCQQGAAED